MDVRAKSNAEAAIGYTFADAKLLEEALTHSSMSGETPEVDVESNGAKLPKSNNERMEFLGDAVLGLCVCTSLYRKYPHLREGDMTKIKSHAVSRETCAAVARKLGLEKHLILGKGMLMSRTLPTSLGAAALESVIGAIYLDGGYDVAAKFIEPLFGPVIDQAARSGHQQNFKSVLQQYAQQELGGTPQYRILDEQGPDHAKAFKICVEVGGRKFEACWGATKKKAEQDAALIALKELGLVEIGEDGDLRVVGE